jgi:S-adenosylmethionine:tRNA ribosyltransferase-isomerase
MKTSQFDYHLPEELIAQDPVLPRDHCKFLVYDSKNDKILHRHFYDLADLLDENDVIVLNDTKVRSARISFEVNNALKEIFILKKIENDKYSTLVRPGRFFKVGRKVDIDDNLSLEVLEVTDDGSRIVRFILKEGDLDNYLENIGQAPLPPYIANSKTDTKEYQTVYAKHLGSVAAPTAGLHFTDELFAKLKADVLKVTLHVGRGTFLPVSAEEIENHKMHSEEFKLDEKTANALNLAVKNNKNILAVGTTSVRVLESSFDNNIFKAQNTETDIFIYPGKYKWKVVDKLITNFHLPKSTLIMLVASFLESKGVKKPIEKVKAIYKEAIKHQYRFYSYGDAMMII